MGDCNGMQLLEFANNIMSNEEICVYAAAYVPIYI